MNCVFCKIVNKEIPSRIIYEDDTVIAILDISQATKGHTLVIPKEHSENLLETDSETFTHLMQVSKLLSRQLINKLDASGINVLINTGESAGQTVLHTHVHLLPRYESDDFKINFIEHKENLDELLETIKG